MKEKREIAKNTHVIHCPYCGADNLFTEQIGTCKFCRRKTRSEHQIERCPVWYISRFYGSDSDTVSESDHIFS